MRCGKPQRHESVVITVAYKGSGKKAKIQGSGERRSDYNKKPQKDALSGVTKAKGHDSRKVHDTKGKNTHGRRNW